MAVDEAVARTDRAHGCIHGDAAGGWDSRSDLCRIKSLIHAHTQIGRAAKQADVRIEVARKQRLRRVRQNVGVEFLSASNPCVAGNPHVAGWRTSVIFIRWEKVVVVTRVKLDSSRNLAKVVHAAHALRSGA